MNLLLYDFKTMGEGDIDAKQDIIYNIETCTGIRACTGCFGCWTKTPGVCVIRDAIQEFPRQLSTCTAFYIVSENCYGGFSVFIKNVLDRFIGYMQPHFTIRNDEMHHISRYPHQLKFTVISYGRQGEQEHKTMEKLVKANGINMNVSSCDYHHVEQKEDAWRLLLQLKEDDHE